MITITPEYNNWCLRFSAPGTGWRTYSTTARTPQEMHVAIDHYHGRNHEPEGCPLCDRSDKRSKAKEPTQ